MRPARLAPGADADVIDEFEDAQEKRSKWRRLTRGTVVALVLAAIGWQVAKRAIDVDQYRPRIEAALAEFTGLPVTIGALELAWHGVPCLSAHDVSIGAGDFSAKTARLGVFPRLAALLHRRLEIARIELVAPAVTLPASREQLASQWRDVLAHVAEARSAANADAATSGPKILIDALIVERASLRFGQDDAHPILSSITVTGIGGEETDFVLEAQVPSTGAHATGTLRVPAREGGDVAGALKITGVQPSAFAELPEVAHTDWQAQAHLSGKLAGELALTVDGSFEPLTRHALSGKFSGRAKIAPDGKTRADLEITGDGLEMQGSARLNAGERSRVRVKKLRAHGRTLAALLAAAARDTVELRPARDAALEVRNFELSLASAPQFTKGALEARGIDLAWRGAVLASELRLDARAADGAIEIAELRGGPFDLRGAVTPDREAHRVALDLSGSIALDAALLHALGAPEAIRSASGVIAVQQLRAELPAEENAHYAVRAQLADGALQLESEPITESISAIELSLTGDDSALHFDARGLGAALGPLTANAAIDPATGSASGSLAFTAAGADFLRDPGARARFTPVLRAYSGAPVGFELKRDADPPNLRRIRFERAAAPRLNAALVLRDDPPDDRLRDLDLSADLPAEALRGFLPETAQAGGVGTLRVRRSEGGAGFFAEADLGGLALVDGKFLEKKAGEALRVRIEGLAGERWNARQLIIAGEQGSFPLAIAEGVVTARELDIDLAAFSFLLVDGARASGRLRLDLDTETESVQLQLSGVALWLSPDLGVDEANGTIAVAGHDWGISGLRVRGGHNDASFDLAVKQGALTGALRGARVDAEFVRAIFDQIEAVRGEHHEPSTPISGVLALALDHVEYGRADARRLAGAIHFAQDDVHVRDLAFEVGEGRVSGRVDITMRKPEPPLLDLDLDFTNLSRRFLDDLLEDESRGVPGLYTGKLRYTAPLRDTVRAMMPDASGTLTAIGHDGTLIGRIGLATKIVTVLRSTEALRMRLPAFRDEGLVFDTVQAEFAMKQGLLEVQQFELDSTSYAISASGELNFREDTSHVPIEVNAIRGITSLVERVPLAGDVLKIVNVRLVATGSPWDMQVQIASITDQLLGAGLAGPKAVLNGVRDVMNLMRSAAGAVQSSPVPPTDPGPAPPAPPEETPAPPP